jgi:hypothetical protein
MSHQQTNVLAAVPFGGTVKIFNTTVAKEGNRKNQTAGAQISNKKRRINPHSHSPR